MSLTWNRRSGYSRIKVYRQIDSLWNERDSLNGGSTSVTENNVDCKPGYLYRLKALGNGSTYRATWSGYSSTAFVLTTCPRPTPAPTGLSGEAINCDDEHCDVSLSWPEPGDNGYRQYAIYRGHHTTSNREPRHFDGTLLDTLGSTDTSYTETNVECGNTYQYRSRHKETGLRIQQPGAATAIQLTLWLDARIPRNRPPYPATAWRQRPRGLQHHHQRGRRPV